MLLQALLLLTANTAIALTEQQQPTLPTSTAATYDCMSNAMTDTTQSNLQATISIITPTIQTRIVGKTWQEACPIPLTNLRYLTIPYWGYDDHEHLGEMIVHQAVAQEVVEIFKELFEAKFPIETMRLIDDFFEPNKTAGEIDDISMAHNNTSSFFFRFIGKTSIISEHGLGTAIDINPRINPFVRGDSVSPSTSKPFRDRTLKGVKGFLTEDSVCVKAFAKRGWHWAGIWKKAQDYQHFCKVQTESMQ
jgi:hypothetical protein